MKVRILHDPHGDLFVQDTELGCVYRFECTDAQYKEITAIVAPGTWRYFYMFPQAEPENDNAHVREN